MSFKEEYQKKLIQVNEWLGKILQKKRGYPPIIFRAMEYSLFAGGKRLRPILLISAHELVDGNVTESMPLACGVEMIHTYSLIHDDLPAMDDDDFRRGVPTNHKVFGEGIAILAGDALLNMAYEIMLENAMWYPHKLDRHVKAISIIANAAGAGGMIGGQVVDLEYEGKVPDGEVLKFIHEHKTGALIVAPLLAGVVLEGAQENIVEAITAYGKDLGLAFQIVDDILDVTGDFSKLGKKPGSDRANEKATFPCKYGLETSKKMAVQLVEEAVARIEFLGKKADFLKQIACFVVNRVH